MLIQNQILVGKSIKLTWKAQAREVKKGLKALWSCNAYIGRTWGLSPKMALSCGDHSEGSSIVVDTENLNCPRPSPQGNELSQILKMVSQTLIFLIPVKKN